MPYNLSVEDKTQQLAEETFFISQLEHIKRTIN